MTWSRRVKEMVCRNGHFRMVSCSPAITCLSITMRVMMMMMMIRKRRRRKMMKQGP